LGFLPTQLLNSPGAGRQEATQTDGRCRSGRRRRRSMPSSKGRRKSLRKIDPIDQITPLRYFSGFAQVFVEAGWMNLEEVRGGGWQSI